MKKVHEKLASVRLTILMCILLALVSLAGTLVPQNMAPEEYLHAYGPAMGRVITTLSIGNIYHSLGFFLLLCLLAVNLLACSLKRFPRILRSMSRERAVPSDTHFEKWKYRDAFYLKSAPAEVERFLERVIRETFGKSPEPRSRKLGQGIYFVERNRFARFGPYVAHLGILMILLGGLVGSISGFRTTIVLPEGEEIRSVTIPQSQETIPLGFTMRCDRFVVDSYPDGTPKEYRSEVTLWKDKEEGKVLNETIRVNHPLTFGGTTFYQSNYGKIHRFDLEIQNRETGEKASVRTELEKPFPLPGDPGGRAVIVDFKEDLRVPPAMLKVTDFPKADLGPAVKVMVLDDGGFGEPFWVFKELPEMAMKKGGPYGFTFSEYGASNYTGLQVSHDPGTPIVWLGCILLVFGFVLSFLFDHEIYWVTSEPSGEKKTAVFLAGRAIRHPAIFSDRFAKRKEKFRERLSPWLAPRSKGQRSAAASQRLEVLNP